MKFVLGVVLLLALGATGFADDPWILKSGPEATDGIPLDPVQLVPGWRGLYSNGPDQFWLYVTKSPHFFAPPRPNVQKIPGTPWTVVVFFPDSWKLPQRTGWLSLWTEAFLTLSSLPTPAWPVLFPSVLTKG